MGEGKGRGFRAREGLEGREKKRQWESTGKEKEEQRAPSTSRESQGEQERGEKPRQRVPVADRFHLDHLAQVMT